MTRFVAHRSIFNRILMLAACLPVLWCIRPPVALGQHNAHVGGVVRIYPPPRPFVPVAPRIGVIRPGGWMYHPRPIGPFRFRPVFPVYASPFYFGPYSWAWGSWGYGGCWWANYYPCGGWGYGYNAPFYAYGPVPAPVYQYYGEPRPEFPELFLKDGTVYSVSDYWLVDDQLHFTTKQPGRKGSVEHVIDVDELDAETSIDENTSRGFRFVLRHEPLQQYMRDYPDQIPPDWPRPKE
jgi:hypothetical protein